MRLGPWLFDTPLILAPMAGVSDRVFRTLCRAEGADYAPSEMTSSDPVLRNTRQTRQRRLAEINAHPFIVQIAGADPQEMADAAREAVDEGAEVIDINMGCPAKRVCNRLAGSALLKDEDLVARILESVVGAVAVPVTLKTRTGWDPENRNAVRVARLAETIGISALTLHGRTRACAYQGAAEYDTIAAVKSAVTIPVIANGDITSPRKAREVLRKTRADGLMIGRAAQGDPWIFARIRAYLANGIELPPPTPDALRNMLLRHVTGLHDLYGEIAGPRIARKHTGWYFARWDAEAVQRRAEFNRLESAAAQLRYLEQYNAPINNHCNPYGEAA